MNIEKMIEDELWESIESNFTSGKYTNAINDAMLFISNLIRDKADLEDDGVKLVNNAFSKNNPKIKVSKLENETEKAMQDGTANILRGMYQLIRNPRHHEKIEDNERDAAGIILFINYMYNIIDKSKSKYEPEDILNLIFDSEFVEDDKYAELIANRIPKRKLLEMVVDIYRKKEEGNIYNIERVFKFLLPRMDKNDLIQFLKIISNDLQVTNNDNERKYILRCIPIEEWLNIDEIPRLRTENKIIKSIEEGTYYETKKSTKGWLATWCTRLFSEFTLKEKLISSIGNILISGDISKQKYCMKYILDTFWKILDPMQLDELENIKEFEFGSDFTYWFFIPIKDEIENGNKLFYDYFHDKLYLLPKQITDYLDESIKKFKENKDIKTKSDDDCPYDFEDDIPF